MRVPTQLPGRRHSVLRVFLLLSTHMALLTSDLDKQMRIASLLAAVVLSNMKPIFSKILYLEGWSPVQLYFVSLLVMAIVLLTHEMVSLERGVRWGMTRRDFRGTIIDAIIGGVIGPVMFFTALSTVTASQTILLTSISPFLVVIFAVLMLGERMNAQMVWGGVFILAGLAAALWDDLSELTLSTGALLLLGSSVCGAFATIVHKKYVKHRHLDSIVFVKTLISLVLVGAWLQFTSEEGLSFLATPQNVWGVMAMPILSFLLPFFLFFKALKKTKATDAGMVAALGRVIALMLASVLLGEALETNHLISISLIVFGVLFINVPLTKWRVVPSRLMEIGPLRK